MLFPRQCEKGGMIVYPAVRGAWLIFFSFLFSRACLMRQAHFSRAKVPVCCITIKTSFKCMLVLHSTGTRCCSNAQWRQCTQKQQRAYVCCASMCSPCLAHFTHFLAFITQYFKAVLVPEILQAGQACCQSNGSCIANALLETTWRA